MTFSFLALAPPLTIAPPLAGLSGNALLAFQLVSTATSYSSEAAGTPAPYSKFASNTAKKLPFPVPSRLGMLVIYVPALIASSYHLSSSSPTATFTSLLSTIHFGKRTLETLFLHKYSGTAPLPIAASIGTYYGLIAHLVCKAAEAAGGGAGEGSTLRLAGTAVFAVGTAGNLYHHYLLRRLRTAPGALKTKYVPPTGGLFNSAAAPHYFFELLAWLGIALVTNQMNAYLVLTSMSSYLAGRAVSQNKWNREKFGEEGWPSSRKNMIPGIW